MLHCVGEYYSQHVTSYVYTTSSATFYIFKVANKARCIIILSMRTQATAGLRNGQGWSTEHLYAAATGEGLCGFSTEQRELEGRATVGVVVSVH